MKFQLQVIFDVHQRYEEAEQCIAEANADKVVLVGDYFDDWDDSPDDARRTALWLRESMQVRNRVHLMGNHDIWYGYQVGDLFCSGNTHDKRRVINEVMPMGWQNRLKLAYFWNDIILSHAGLHPALFEHPVKGPTQDYINTRLGKARENIFSAPNDPVLGASRSRGGRNPVGGPLWLDWSEMEFLGDWNQIVGHTPGRDVRVHHNPNETDSRQFNICGDTHSRHYLLITNEYVDDYFTVFKVEAGTKGEKFERIAQFPDNTEEDDE